MIRKFSLVHSHLITDKLSVPEPIKVLSYGTPEVKTNSPVKIATIKTGYLVLDILLF